MARPTALTSLSALRTHSVLATAVLRHEFTAKQSVHRRRVGSIQVVPRVRLHRSVAEAAAVAHHSRGALLRETTITVVPSWCTAISLFPSYSCGPVLCLPCLPALAPPCTGPRARHTLVLSSPLSRVVSAPVQGPTLFVARSVGDAAKSLSRRITGTWTAIHSIVNRCARLATRETSTSTPTRSRTRSARCSTRGRRICSTSFNLSNAASRRPLTAL